MGEKIAKIRTSRKLYIPYYAMILTLIGLVIFAQIKGISLHKYVFWGVFVFCALIIKYVEVHRLRNTYEIHSDALVHSSGLLSQKVKSIDFFAISDLDVSQTIFQRLLNFGDVNVRLFSKDSTTCVKDITNPREFARVLEETISKRRATIGRDDKEPK